MNTDTQAQMTAGAVVHSSEITRVASNVIDDRGARIVITSTTQLVMSWRAGELALAFRMREVHTLAPASRGPSMKMSMRGISRGLGR